MQGPILSPGQRRLIEVIQRLGFGRIEALVVRRGEPDFDHNTRIRRERKFGGDPSPQRTTQTPHAQLKSEVCELLQELASIGDGVVDCVEVRHGLPFRLITSQPLRPEGGES